MPRRISVDTAIGQRIRERRELAGWSIRHAADRAGIAPSTWSRIEHGLISADNRTTLAAVAQALRCPVADLTSLPADPVSRDRVETGGAIYETVRAVVDADLGCRPDGVELDCRPDGSTPPPAEPLARLGRELDLVRDLRARCEYVAAATRLPALIRGLHRAAFGPERDRALRALVITLDTASFVVRYAGHPGSACLVADRTQQAAEATEDPVLLGLAAWARAHAALGMGLVSRAGQVAERGIRDLGRGKTASAGAETYGQLLLTLAFAWSAQGRTADVDAPLAEAEAIARRTGESTALRLMFGPTNINFWRIAMAADGDDPGYAVDVARGTRPHLVDSVSRQFAFYADTGRALARIGNDREALRLLLTAERLGPQRMRTPLIVETVRGMLDRSRRGTGWTELRGLCERLGLGG
ncbi:helix-turn-helix domain-containing protein [Micromonospora sp. NPDC003197]